MLSVKLQVCRTCEGISATAESRLRARGRTFRLEVAPAGSRSHLRPVTLTRRVNAFASAELTPPLQHRPSEEDLARARHVLTLDPFDLAPAAPIPLVGIRTCALKCRTCDITGHLREKSEHFPFRILHETSSKTPRNSIPKLYINRRTLGK